jgi:NADPH:quinone reductase-like Zn-dependent oxidoreductase
VRAAGIRTFGAGIELLELPGPPAPGPDEVLIDVRACGIGNWDEIARAGDWDLGLRPPMALGVEAAGLVAPDGRRLGALVQLLAADPQAS